MTSIKKLHQITKHLFKESLTENLIDETKVKKILKAAESLKPQERVKVLKIYKGLVEKALSWEELVVEGATEIDTKEQGTLIAKTKARNRPGKTILSKIKKCLKS